MASRHQDGDDDPALEASESVSAPAGGWAAAVASSDPGKGRREDTAKAPEPPRWTRRLADLAGRMGRTAQDASQRLLAAVWDALPGQTPEPAAPLATGGPALPPPMEVPTTPSLEPDEARRRVEDILSRLPPKGDPSIPAHVVAAALLLADEVPLQDFQAVDLLQDAFPRGTRQSDSRVLMAIARALTRDFGRPGRLPIASAKAWAMLDPILFSDELAAQLSAICSFVQGWQARESSFLILEFSEIELIEYLFENLHPGRHRQLLVQVMDFKVLSARRVGLLRRIPSRIRRVIELSGPRQAALARDYHEASLALLAQLSRPENFSAVAMAARIALAEAEKISLPTSSPPPPSPPPSLHPVMRGLSAPEPPPPPAPPTASAPPPAAPMVTTPLNPIPVSVVATPRLSTLSVSVAASPPHSLPSPPPSLPSPPSISPLPAKRRRFTKVQKTEAVLRLLQGEAAETLAQSLGIDIPVLEGWRDTFLGGGTSALVQPKPAEPTPPPDTGVNDLKDQLKALIHSVAQISAQMEQLPPDPGEQPTTPRQADLPLALPSIPDKPPKRRKRKTTPPAPL
ncbi:hypothetical protein A6A04_04540 [Paramagnetospirillum marisnigri]|uniref:Uncharacterized protein n=1 Tax=Paramagnetospirillum marisnigri TaxID=1285242 RepID=A0A178MH69_9PROT|nr:hypothetical protein A6A04_04540 [Paramagnetospirillum marisnigri]